MLIYILRRLLLMIPTLFGITLLVFFVMAMAPGGIGSVLQQEGSNMRPEEEKALREYYNERYGLDQPLIVQYFKWLYKVSPVGFAPNAEGWQQYVPIKQPDLGQSFIRNQPVWNIVWQALPATLLLNIIALPLAYGVAIVSGIYAARYKGQAFDITSGVIFLALWSLPVMWVGVMLIGFFASDKYFNWFPTGNLYSPGATEMAFLPGYSAAGGWSQGYLLDVVWHLILPVICLVYGSFAFLSKLMRSSMLENMAADFVRTAKAKGVRDHVILFHHVLRNSLLPLITMAAGLIPALLSGSLIVEKIFSIEGMGKLMIDAITMRDREIVMSVTLVISLIGLLSLLVRDILYSIADPRVTYE